MKIRRFYEMYEDTYDYKKIIKSLNNKFGWGLGVINSIDEFESNEEYFFNPATDEDYIIQFHIFLKDKEVNNLRGKFNNRQSLKLGKWNFGNQVDAPVSIYNKLY